jgi:hypothetical protein
MAENYATCYRLATWARTSGHTHHDGVPETVQPMASSKLLADAKFLDNALVALSIVLF